MQSADGQLNRVTCRSKLHLELPLLVLTDGKQRCRNARGVANAGQRHVRDTAIAGLTDVWGQHPELPALPVIRPGIMAHIRIQASVTGKHWSQREGWGYYFDVIQYQLDDEFKLAGELAGVPLSLEAGTNKAAETIIRNAGWQLDELRKDQRLTDDLGAAWLDYDSAARYFGCYLALGTETKEPYQGMLDTALSSTHLAIAASLRFGFSVAEDNPYSNSPTPAAFLAGTPVFANLPIKMSLVRRMA